MIVVMPNQEPVPTVAQKERSFIMWDLDLETYVDGYIYATSYGHYVVMREGLPARNWQDLEAEARQEVWA
jgi:hypothetical protein